MELWINCAQSRGVSETGSAIRGSELVRDLEIGWGLFFGEGSYLLYCESAELRSPKSLNQLVHKPGDSEKASFDVTLVLFTAGACYV